MSNCKEEDHTLLDRTVAPSFTWLLAMTYFCFVLNQACNQEIVIIPMNVAACLTCDVSPLLRFHFCQPVYFNSDDSSFQSKSTEQSVRFVGINENVGHDMTFSILNVATNKVVSRSNVRLVDETTSPNLRINTLTTPGVVTSRHFALVYLKNDEEAPVITEDEAPNAFNSSPNHMIPITYPHDLVGRNFLMSQEDSQRLRSRIVKAIDDQQIKRDSERLKFICSTKYDIVEDLFTYNETLNHINNSENDDLVEWKFKLITSHEGHLARSRSN